MGKDMLESSPREEIQWYCQRKISFHGNIQRDVLFAEKVVLCYRCKTRHMIGENCPVITPTQKDSSMSFTERLLLHGIQALDSLIILQRLFLVLNLCNNLLPWWRMWLEGIALEKFLIRIRILNQAQGHALILIHIVNLTLGLSILQKNSLLNLQRKLHQRFLKIRRTWEDFSTRARSKCTSEMYLPNNKNVP